LNQKGKDNDVNEKKSNGKRGEEIEEQKYVTGAEGRARKTLTDNWPSRGVANSGRGGN